MEPTWPSARCLRWYALRWGIIYTGPSPAQPAKRLMRRSLGPTSFFYDPSHASDGNLFSRKLNNSRLTSIQNRYSKIRDDVNLIIRNNKTRAWSRGSSVGWGRIDEEKGCAWDRIFNKIARTLYGLFDTILLCGPNKGLQATWQGVQSLRWDAFQESV
jgi:hypothetical protein